MTASLSLEFVFDRAKLLGHWSPRVFENFLSVTIGYEKEQNLDFLRIEGSVWIGCQLKITMTATRRSRWIAHRAHRPVFGAVITCSLQCLLFRTLSF